jgi:hypothetical protein
LFVLVCNLRVTPALELDIDLDVGHGLALLVDHPSLGRPRLRLGLGAEAREDEEEGAGQCETLHDWILQGAQAPSTAQFLTSAGPTASVAKSPGYAMGSRAPASAKPFRRRTHDSQTPHAVSPPW